MPLNDDYKTIVDTIKKEVEENLRDLKPLTNPNRTAEQQAYVDGFNCSLVLILKMITDLQLEHSITYRIEQLFKDLKIADNV